VGVADGAEGLVLDGAANSATLFVGTNNGVNSLSMDNDTGVATLDAATTLNLQGGTDSIVVDDGASVIDLTA